MKKKIALFMEFIMAFGILFGIFPFADICAAESGNIAFFKEADNVYYQGNVKTQQCGKVKHQCAVYTNTSVDSSKYIIYSNAVDAGNGKNYDLVLYPFKTGNKDALVAYKVEGYGYVPAFYAYNDELGCKIKITEHGNINSPVSMCILLSIADLDKNEWIATPTSINITHKGKNIVQTDGSHSGTNQYTGTINADSSKAMYDFNSVLGKLNVPISGVTVYYGNKSNGLGATLAFKELKDYWNNNGGIPGYDPPSPVVYTIKFNANNGNGSVPSTITKEGADTSVVMGDITSDVPTRAGYIFRGWSASSSFSSKRIAYSSSYGGATAKDGTSATITSSSWSFSDYCNYTGGSTSSRTLTLYAQWERDVSEYKIVFDANGGTGSVPSTITKEGTDTSVVMGDIGGAVPTRSGYVFKGWSASSSWNSKRIAFTSAAGGSAASDGTSAKITSSSWTFEDYCNNTGGSSSNDTLTLYAMWRTAYTHTLNYNANGGTGAPSSSTITNDSTATNLTVSDTVPVRTGYTFLGWNTKADGTGISYSAGDSVSVGSNSTVTLYAQWQVNKYDVIYIDIDKDSGEELNRQVIKKDYGSIVKGTDIGSSTTDNAYYNNYALIPGADGYTTSVVNENGTAVVYRYFKWLSIDIEGTISWNDHENLYRTRPNSIGVTLYRDGEYFDYVTVPAANTANKYSFDQLQKYDLETGREFVYTVKQDVAYSQAALEHSEDKYTTIQNGFDFLNDIRNTERPTKPGYPDEPVDPDNKGLHVEGEIYWDDNEDSLGFRPSEVTITIYQKGEDGKWKPFGEPIIVDAKNDNHYLFDWLPKYWYDENDVPTAYEYKVEESFEAWYVKDEEIKDAYVIHTDQPNDFDFTNELIPDGPIIPVTEHVNTIIVKTNTDEPIRIILKPLELFIHDDYSVSYGFPNGNDVLLFPDKTGVTAHGLPSTRYEITIDSSGYILDNIRLALSENMKLEEIDGKWYVTILNVPKNAIGTLEIELSKKELFYQDAQRFVNYFAAGDKLSKETKKIHKMAKSIAMPYASVLVEYRGSDTTDGTVYMQGDEIKVLDYLGFIPAGSEFAGWSMEEGSDKAEYLPGDTIKAEENIVLYPVFSVLEGQEELEPDSGFEEQNGSIDKTDKTNIFILQ